MNGRERFIGVMEFQKVDKIPNYEVAAWAQTVARWAQEGLPAHEVSWDWFTGCPTFDFDPREYIPVQYHMMPGFPYEVLERTERYEIARSYNGIVTKALLEGSVGGMRASMDQYLSYPVETPEDWKEMKKRYDPNLYMRYPLYWDQFNLEAWKRREHPLVLGRNGATTGYYWRMREWMGTENLSYAWYDYPSMLHDMCEFITDFTIAVSEPILQKITPDYVFINEDMAMKSGPLLSPKQYTEFIYPEMKRLVDYFKGKGIPYVIVDTDGNSEPLMPMLFDAGVDGLFPIERASDDQDPYALRKKYGKKLRIFGVVDKRELAKDYKAIDEHMRSLIPLVEEGGVFPGVDHAVPPDVSLDNFKHYMEKKEHLLRYEFEKI